MSNLDEKEIRKEIKKEELDRATRNNARNFDTDLKIAKIHPVGRVLWNVNKYSGGKLTKIAGKKEALKARRNPFIGRSIQDKSNKIAESGMSNNLAQGYSKKTMNNSNNVQRKNINNESKQTSNIGKEKEAKRNKDESNGEIKSSGKMSGFKAKLIPILGVFGLISVLFISIFVAIFGLDEDDGEGNSDGSQGNISNPNISYTDNDVCQKYVLNDSIKIRLYYNLDPDKQRGSWGDPENNLPGGYYIENELGIAKETIPLKQYLQGVTVAEMSPSSNIEALKFQMLMAKTFLFYKVDGNSNYINSDGEYFINATSVFQNYKQTRYNDYIVNGQYAEKLDTIYNAIKDLILLDEDGSITAAHYTSGFQDVVKLAANDNYLFTEILNHEEIKNTSRYKESYATASISSCSAGGNYSTGDVIEDFILNARKYVGMTRNDFALATGVNTEGSWCARFVSQIIKETPEIGIDYSSASVSSFMENYFIKNNRFCHSQYWANKTDKFVCNDSPKKGDIIMFAKNSCEYQGNGNMPTKTDNCYRHIGIVSLVESNTIHYIHGNTSNCAATNNNNGVCESAIKYNDSYIIGYGR